MSEQPVPARDREAVARYVERLASALMEGGIPRMPARVFAALLATDSGQLTAAELADRLQASPAAISGAIRYLNQVGLVHRDREPGSRRDHYRLPADLWVETMMSRDQTLNRWQTRLREGVDVVGPDTPAGRRLAESVDFIAFVDKELPALVDRWKERRASLASHPQVT